MLYMFILRLTGRARREQEELEKALQISLEAQRKQTTEAEKLRDEVKQSTSAKPSPVESKPAPKTSPPVSQPEPKPSPAVVQPAPKPSPAVSKPETKPSPAVSKPEPKPSPPVVQPVPKPSPVKSKSPTQPETKLSGLPPLSGQPRKAADTPADAAAGWMKSAKEDAASGTSVAPAKVNIMLTRTKMAA